MAERERLGSRLGFLMLAAGCAVGLGNVWRFPFVVGQNGGAAFVLVYLVFLALLGFPLLTAELAVGRGSARGISGAFQVLAPESRRTFWTWLGRIVFGGNLLLMIYYTAVGGWLLRYATGYVVQGLPFVGTDSAATFNGLLSNPAACTFSMLAGVVLATGVCMLGVQGGVERITKGMMLSLLALLGVLAAKSLSLPGAEKGLAFYLKPDWTPFLAHPFQTCFDAMGQAFFTLSTGVGAMTIFGSYIGKERSLVTESIWIIVIDTCVALLAGLIIFPACAAFDVDVTAGPGLIFIALPKVFAHMAGGRFWGALFFVFLSLAALTTIIAVFECQIGGLMDELRQSRARMALLVGVVVAVLALPTVFGYNVWSDVHLLPGKTILDVEDYIFSQFWLPLGAMSICIFCSRRNGWGWTAFQAEAGAGRGFDLPSFFGPYMRWILPPVLVGILVAGL